MMRIIIYRRKRALVLGKVSVSADNQIGAEK